MEETNRKTDTEENALTQCIDRKQVTEFEQHLREEEKSRATIEKYMRDVRYFLQFLSELKITGITKNNILAYKEQLSEQYAPASVNSMLTAVNQFLRFIGKEKLKVKLLKIQRQIFCAEDKELTRAEYQRLLKTAENTRISYIMQTICGTGIRISELQYITAEAVADGKATVNCKGKKRVIFIPLEVKKLLHGYMKKNNITSGPVFVTKNGKPLNRSNIWRDMRALCQKANISEKKVFPHNLRHLFARTFYSINKDIVRLADLLGHSSINTTRIYTVESGEKHLIYLEKVQKILTT